jgi:hypothetical protein
MQITVVAFESGPSEDDKAIQIPYCTFLQVAE